MNHEMPISSDLNPVYEMNNSMYGTADGRYVYIQGDPYAWMAERPDL